MHAPAAILGAAATTVAILAALLAGVLPSGTHAFDQARRTGQSTSTWWDSDAGRSAAPWSDDVEQAAQGPFGAVGVTASDAVAHTCMVIEAGLRLTVERHPSPYVAQDRQ